jgi:thiosulfate dehydrogenase [quinone] large subunit
MFIQWLREKAYLRPVFLILRLYVGWKLLTSGLNKYGGEGFDATGFLVGAVKKSTGERPAVQGWWATFLDGFAIPNAGLFNFLVPLGEVLVGGALILGIFTTFSALMGMVMNFSYLLSGTTSTNPQLLLFELIIALAAYNAGKWGLDRWVLPWLKANFVKKGQRRNETYQAG